MPSTATAGATKRKRPAFSPPRPKASRTAASDAVSTSTTGKSKSRPTQSNKRQPSRLTSVTPSATDSTAESEPESASRSASPDSEPDYVLAEVTHNERADDNEPTIPLALVHTLLNHHFKDKNKTRISQDAKAVIGKYIDTFVREAIARSAYERQEKSTEGVSEELNGRGDDGWLEVEDLEKMAPQLVLDF